MGKYRLQEKRSWRGTDILTNGVIDPYKVLNQMLSFLERAGLVFVNESANVLREGKSYHSADLSVVIKELGWFMEDVKKARADFFSHPESRLSKLLGIAVMRKGIVNRLRYFKNEQKTTRDAEAAANIQEFVNKYLDSLQDVVAELNEVIAEESRRLATLGSPGKLDPIELITLAEVLLEAWVRHWDK